MNSDHDTLLRGWVAPFGDPGITDRSHLPRAFRSVPRPSSPLSAKASTRCPSFVARSTMSRPDLPNPAGPQPRNHRPRTWKTAARTGASPEPADRLHVKTLFERPRTQASHLAPRGPSASVTFTNSLHPSINTRPRPGAAGGHPSARPPRTRERCLGLLRMPVSGDQEPGVRTPRSGRSSDLCRRSSDPVEVNGIEPMTSCLQSRRSPN